MSILQQLYINKHELFQNDDVISFCKNIISLKNSILMMTSLPNSLFLGFDSIHRKKYIIDTFQNGINCYDNFWLKNYFQNLPMILPTNSEILFNECFSENCSQVAWLPNFCTSYSFLNQETFKECFLLKLMIDDFEADVSYWTPSSLPIPNKKSPNRVN